MDSFLLLCSLKFLSSSTCEVPSSLQKEADAKDPIVIILSEKPRLEAKFIIKEVILDISDDSYEDSTVHGIPLDDHAFLKADTYKDIIMDEVFQDIAPSIVSHLYILSL